MPVGQLLCPRWRNKGIFLYSRYQQRLYAFTQFCWVCGCAKNTSLCFHFRGAPQHVYWGRTWKSAEPCGQTAPGEPRQTTHHVQGVDPVQVSQASRSIARDSWRRHGTRLQLNLVIFRWCGCFFFLTIQRRMPIVVVIKGDGIVRIYYKLCLGGHNVARLLYKPFYSVTLSWFYWNAFFFFNFGFNFVCTNKILYSNLLHV